jgi:hypothetical protein
MHTSCSMCSTTLFGHTSGVPVSTSHALHSPNTSVTVGGVALPTAEQ